MDTGALVSLINSKVFRQMGLYRKLQLEDLFISQPDSSQIRIEGMTWLPFKLARTTGELKVYLAPHLCRELILGSDWFKLNEAQICFNLVRLVLGGIEVPLKNEVEKKKLVVAQ